MSGAVAAEYRGCRGCGRRLGSVRVRQGLPVVCAGFRRGLMGGPFVVLESAKRW